MDLLASIAASRLAAQQRAMEVTADNFANANTPGYKEHRVQFSDWLSRQRGAHHRLYPGPRHLARAAARHAEPYRQPARPGADRRRLFHRQHAERPAADARRAVRADARRPLADGAGNAVLDTNGQPIRVSPADTQAHRRRRRNGVQRERAARQDRRGHAQRPDADHCRGRHAVPRRHADHAGQPHRPSCRARSRIPTSSRCWS